MTAAFGKDLRRATVVWIGLVLATLITWWLGTDHPLASTNVRLASALAILLAMAKVWYVGMDFMELRGAPPALRRVFDCWAVVVGAALVVLYVT